jgi:hypothetical protein
MTHHLYTPPPIPTTCTTTYVKGDHVHTVSCTIRRPSCDAPQIQTSQFPPDKHPFPKHNVHRVHTRPPVPLRDGLEVFVEDIGVIRLQEVKGPDNKGWVVYRGTNLRVGYTELWIAVKPRWVAGRGRLLRGWRTLTQTFSL